MENPTRYVIQLLINNAKVNIYVTQLQFGENLASFFRF
jgi:hypothetical protein